MNRNPKHWLRREENQVVNGQSVTVYIVACGKPGLPRKETSANLCDVTCPHCAAKAPRKSLHQAVTRWDRKEE